MKQETLADLIEYRKRARFVLGKLHRELEKKEMEIKLLEERLKKKEEEIKLLKAIEELKEQV